MNSIYKAIIWISTIILLAFCSSCSTSLEVENMEMVYVDLGTPGLYYHFNASLPGESWKEYPVGEGPYKMIIKTNSIQVNTNKPIKQALHLRGKYGRDAVPLELSTRNSFKVIITDPDPYAETFRIYF